MVSATTPFSTKSKLILKCFKNALLKLTLVKSDEKGLIKLPVSLSKLFSSWANDLDKLI